MSAIGIEGVEQGTEHVLLGRVLVVVGNVSVEHVGHVDVLEFRECDESWVVFAVAVDESAKVDFLISVLSQRIDHVLTQLLCDLSHGFLH